MEHRLEEETVLRRYLLGESSMEERVSVEARLFLDDEYSSQLKAVEDELIDDYAYDELTAGEREEVESRLLSEPGRREDLRIARAFKRYLSQNENGVVTPPVAPADDSRPASDTKEDPSPPGKGFISFLASLFQRRPVVAYAFAAGALIILSVLIWSSLESPRRQGPSPQMQAQESTPQQSQPAEREQTGGELQRNQRPPEQRGDIAQRSDSIRHDGGSKEKVTNAGRRDIRPREARVPTQQTTTQVATFLVLPGGVVRGPGGSEKVTLPPGVGVVILRLPLVTTGDYQHYRATLQDESKIIYSRDDLKPEVDAELGQVVAVKIPASLLRPRRYQIKIGGVTAAGVARDLGSYTFQVEKP